MLQRKRNVLPSGNIERFRLQWACAMKDNQRPSTEAGDKRALAAFVRRVAATVSLKADRDALLAQAAAIEAEAERIERTQQE
jgi:hypothetical protein